MPDRHENETLEAKLARSHDASLKMIEDKQAEQEGREPNYYWRKKITERPAAMRDAALIKAISAAD